MMKLNLSKTCFHLQTQFLSQKNSTTRGNSFILRGIFIHENRVWYLVLDRIQFSIESESVFRLNPAEKSGIGSEDH